VSAPEAWHVTRTMRALELLAIAPRSAPELAGGLGIHPRTARRILNRLQNDGYVEARPGDPRRRYGPTMRVAALGGLVVERADLTQIALPHIEALQRDLGESCSLCVPAHRSVLCVIYAAGCLPTGCRPRLGELMPAHATAAGKALLAEREQWRETVLTNPLERFTDRTITGRQWLRRQLTLTAARGYAIEDREHRPDTRALAVPVRTHDRQAIAALALTAPAAHLPPETIRETAQTLTENAARISYEFGSVSPR